MGLEIHQTSMTFYPAQRWMVVQLMMAQTIRVTTGPAMEKVLRMLVTSTASAVARIQLHGIARMDQPDVAKKI